MVKLTLKVDGMACSMCESHVNDCIRRRFNVRKVTSSHKKGITEIITETSPDENALVTAISEIGYKVLSVSVDPYEK